MIRSEGDTCNISVHNDIKQLFSFVFLMKIMGVFMQATPLLLTLVVLELSDIAFAVRFSQTD